MFERLFNVSAFHVAMASLFCVSAAVSRADVEYFVDAENGSDGWDGSSATFVSEGVGPMKTVGAAVARANADGAPSVVTLLPGRYDKGEYYEDGMTNRIVITEPHLKIRSTGGKENTFIVGNRDKTNANGIGPAAVRGIYIKADLLGLGAAGNNNDPNLQATNVVIEGVTICNCATVGGKNGGAVYSSTPDGGGASLLIDCVVSNCAAAQYGGALYRQNAYRTLFADNYAGTAGDAMAFGHMACCVATRNKGAAVTYTMRGAVNCTFARNAQHVFHSGYTMYCYNCLSFANGLGNGCHPSSSQYVEILDTVGAAPMRTFAGRVARTETNATPWQCASTAFQDWRLLSDSPAIGKGQGKWLTDKALKLPPGYSFQDYLGNPIDTSGAVDCGAVQSAAVTPESGRIEFTAPFRMDGYNTVSANNTYHYPTNGAAACRIRSVPVSGRPYMVSWAAPGGMAVNMVPQYDGWTRIMPPAGTDSAITAVTYTATQVLYVDKSTGDDSYDGLSPDVQSETAGPKKTLQGAADAVTADYALVYVAPGVYDEGEKPYVESGYVSTNRLYTKKSTSTGFIAAQGPGTVTIKGAPDPDTGGLGPGAIRCFFATGKSFLQGFVLQDGYALNVNDAVGRGGAAYFGNASDGACLADCVVRNCHSHLGVVFHGYCWRTRFFDNHATGGELFRYAKFGSCIFAGNASGSGYAMFRAACSLWGCTIDKLDNDMKLHYENTVDGAFCGNLLATRLASPVPADGGNVLTTDPLFADRSARDFRLCARSPAIGTLSRSDFYANGMNYFAPADINGDDCIWTDGAASAGAVQNKPLALYVVTSEGGGIAVDGGSAGTNVVSEAATLTVTATDTDVRPFLGFEVDGSMLPASQTVYTFSVSPESDSSPVVRALYGTTWYVDSTGGLDSNSGGTLATAKQTIRAATTNAVAGDVVLVAPGTYGADEGVQLHPAFINRDVTTRPITVGARVLVPQNVTVRSIEGPESTVIMGSAATSGANEWGCGEDAVRCATLLGTGARIEGFTLTGGRTAAGSDAHDDNAAAGVLSASGGFACDCIISNNVASQCGAIFRGTLVDCRVIDNKATVRASVGRESSFLRCVIDRNKGEQQAIQYFSTINSCTFGPDNGDLDGKPQFVVAYRNSDSSEIANTIMLGSVYQQSNAPYAIRNCAFRSDRCPDAGYLTDCVVTNAGMLALDGCYRPVVGSNAAIDMGDASRINQHIDDGHDLSGLQRIMNGAMDIGALEADWRPVYSWYIGGRRLSVTNVSSEVYANAAHEVCLPSGSIDGTVDVAHAPSRWFEVSFRVTGGGTFTIYIDGTPVGAYTYAAGVQSARIPLPADAFGVKFEYAPGANDAGGAIISSARVARGFVLSYR